MRTYPVGCPMFWHITMKIYINVNSNFRVHCGWTDCGGTRMAFLTRFGFVYHISINLQPSMNYKLLQHIEQHKESEKFQVYNLLFVNTKIQQTKMLVTCQRFDDLFLFGLVWQYSINQNQYDKDKGRFKVMATFLQHTLFLLCNGYLSLLYFCVNILNDS